MKILQHTLMAVSLLLGAFANGASATSMAAPVVTAVFGADGKLWRAIPRKDHLEVDYSTDHGATFSAPVRVNAKRQRVHAVPEDRPAIAVDKQGNVFVTWAADGHKPWTRYIAWSRDGGRSFSAPVEVSDAADRTLQYQTTLQAIGDGAARVFWVDARDQRNGSSVGSLFLATFDRGQWRGPRSEELHASMCECCRFQAVGTAGGGSAVMSRLVIDGGTRDVGIVSVAADGKASVRRTSDDGWQINACPEHGPSLAIGPGGRYHMSWFTMGAEHKGIFYAHSDDGGRTVSEPVAIGDPTRLAGHASVATLGDRVAIAWQEYDGKRTSIHAMVSGDKGNTWGEPRDVASSSAEADYPFALSDGRDLYVSWYAADSGYHLFPLAQADGL